MKKINVKVVEGRTQDTVTKIPVTVIEETDKKSEAVQKFKIIVPENEYPEPIKLKMKIVEEQREEKKIVLKEN